MLDAVAVILLVAASGAFGLGESALSHADDLEAFYWLVIGVVGVRAAVQFGRPEKA
jgi:hypothetical protein